MFTVGQKVTWYYDIPRGWNWTVKIPVTIVKIGRKRVQVEAPLQKGGTKLVWVTPEKLGE